MKIIPEMNRLEKHNEYLFMQDGAHTAKMELTQPRWSSHCQDGAHTTKLTLEMLKDKKQLRSQNLITGHRIVQI